jgi:mono/diheme cytochrome c family protein
MKTYALILSGCWLVGCAGASTEGEDEPVTDADTDADSDADTDADADTDTDTDVDTPSYSEDVFPVYALYCGDCHASWGGPDAPDEVYDALLEGERGEPFIIPGDRANSWYYDKIANDAPADGKARMPVATDPVDAETLADWGTWITDGANDDADWQVLFQSTWMRMHCHNCHDTWGRDSSTVLESLLTLTERGYPMIDPGNPDNSYVYLKLGSSPPYGATMPLRFDYLTDEQIEAVGAWIDSGAPDN